jgi:tetratricopeptide (TPR) repeat protein
MYSCRMRPVFSLLVLFVIVNPVLSGVPSKSFEQISKEADAARQAERLNDAISLYQAGLRLRPGWSEGWWALGTLLYDQDRFPEALTAFRRFVAITPTPGPAYAFLALCEYETQQYDGALRHFRLWARNGWTGTKQLIDVSVFHFALMLTREGRFVEALYLLSIEASKMGDTPAISEAMGLASLRMRNLPEDYPPERRELVWLAGQAAFYASDAQRDFARVDEYANRMESRYKETADVHYLRGTLFTFENKSSDAEREFRDELQVSPSHVPAMLGLVTIDLDENRLTEAATFAKRAVEIEPTSAEAHHQWGQVLMATSNFEESAQELRRAKQLAPNGAMIRSHLAMVYSRLGRTQEAKAEADAFLALKAKEGVLAPPEPEGKSRRDANRLGEAK